MKFVALNQSTRRDSVIIYRGKDHTLATVPQRAGVGFSLSINDVQIELTEDGKWDSIWGYCPRQSWTQSVLMRPQGKPGDLQAITATPMVPGASVRVGPRRWPVVFCPGTSWLCFGDPNGSAAYQVEFAPGAIVAGDEANIVALWLHVTRFE